MFINIFFAVMKVSLFVEKLYLCGMKIVSFLKRLTRISLVVRILIGLVIGVLLGMFFPQWTAVGILGKVFVSALKAVAPVLVAVLVAPRSWQPLWRWWAVFSFLSR